MESQQARSGRYCSDCASHTYVDILVVRVFAVALLFLLLGLHKVSAKSCRQKIHPKAYNDHKHDFPRVLSSVDPAAADRKRFDVAKHFDTVPELADRAFNRPRKETLETAQVLLVEEIHIYFEVYIIVFGTRGKGRRKRQDGVFGCPSL